MRLYGRQLVKLNGLKLVRLYGLQAVMLYLLQVLSLYGLQLVWLYVLQIVGLFVLQIVRLYGLQIISKNCSLSAAFGFRIHDMICYELLFDFYLSFVHPCLLQPPLYSLLPSQCKESSSFS